MDTTRARLEPADSRERAVELAAQALRDAAVEAVAQRGRFSLALSGGSTPLPLFRLLSRVFWQTRIPWALTTVAWVDERCVPPEHAASNYGAARAALAPLARVRLALPMNGVLPPEEGARAYERDLEAAPLERAGAMPRFDCVLLGMGSDGHIASLFPASTGLEETRRAVVAQYPTDVPHARLSLTLPALNAARLILLLVTGRGKRAALQRAFSAPEPSGPLMPVQLLRPENGVLRWIVDKEAASALSTRQWEHWLVSATARTVRQS